MPDISILQEDTNIQLRESRVPGVFYAVSVVLMLISIGAYAGLFFYKIQLQKDLNFTIETIDNLQVGNISGELGRLSGMEGQLNILKKLRIEHTHPANLLSIVAASVDKNVYYQNAEFNAKSSSVNLKGVAVNPSGLAKQVSLYRQQTNISDYNISDVGFIGEGVGFSTSLKIKP